ncbi:bifunctional acetate--CoA ligase family protein/GNAT family N-acetyltransferase [Tenggerimyces flavus]|uniref:GNAT family N-acetyltransferase n=1 Tax=Tenggerimyces flavus TaxID=1708749 RepID=A0ABV7YGG8_9ACTN|nr:GNAT family N-acetyltransferase [Tenggerimyces flavus]MBM7787259.1 acyl-CoA synthetase (NDP forming)/GNAT superfamily N-acetyltransferase [Tenggerimyces flavus]
MTDLPYPAHWEADVVLRDGGTAVLRPIRSDDDDRLVAFYSRVSEQSKYLRFFAPYPKLSRRDVDRFTQVDHIDRVGMILTVADEMIAVGRYDRVAEDEAEVAFLVEDSHQGRGVGSVLLEHLAQAARENGVRKFIAEVLPENRKMVTVFKDAGYNVSGGFEDGVVQFELEIEPTDTSIRVMTAREHRAEARSVERILTPSSVAVVGASRSRDKVGAAFVRNLVLGGFTGPVYAVNPTARAVAGVPAYGSLLDVPGEIDLAVVAVPAESVNEVVLEAAAKNVHALLVVSSGFAETGREGKKRQHELVRVAHAHGLRVVGPAALGVINTDPAYALNASLSPVVPARGKVGFFCQSGALGTVILQTVASRGLGLSTFVSAGNRADVSGNDLMQYWEEDAATDVVLLYLESVGNPRKFNRIARRLSVAKPVVAVRSGRFTQGVPLGHSVHAASVPQAAVDAMFAQAGVMLVDTLDQMLDVAQVLAYQPLPDGSRLGIVGNSDALGMLAADAAVETGMAVARQPAAFLSDVSAEDLERAVAEMVGDDGVDAVVVVYVSPLDVDGTEVAHAIARATADSVKPVVTTFLGTQGVPEPLRRVDEQGVAVHGSVPSYASPDVAVRALAKVTRYAEWRARPRGRIPVYEDVDTERARAIIENVLTDHPKGTVLSESCMRELLACYGIDVWQTHPVSSVDEAVVVAEKLGWDVVLKGAAPHLRQRPDLADVWRNIAAEDEMRSAWTTLSATIGDPSEARFVVQKMAGQGVPVVVACAEDPMFGPIVWFGLAGVATELLGDQAFRIPPLTDVDASNMVREVRAAPLLFGHSGGDHVDVGRIEDLLHRISRLAYDIPEVLSAELTPVLAGPTEAAVLGAAVRVGPADLGSRTDWFVRRLDHH